ncbi:hypothetical protein L810_3639 [Burkholderia sp. AU4i]|nr:hypothetical protein L810_3639 [Burkholderia sp. AU4i]
MSTPAASDRFQFVLPSAVRACAAADTGRLVCHYPVSRRVP